MASAMHAMVDKASWVPDPCVADCEKCHKRFNQYRRKHHCRNCGHVFCWECSGLKYDLLVPAKKGGYEKGTRKVRVCEACFDTLSDIAATGANAMGGAGPSPMRQVRPCYLRPSPHAAADAAAISRGQPTDHAGFLPLRSQRPRPHPRTEPLWRWGAAIAATDTLSPRHARVRSRRSTCSKPPRSRRGWPRSTPKRRSSTG
jgi:hypothetical protein